jgi:hypothetical protein
VSWQITPRALTDAITDPDRAAAKRAFDAMMTMQKIDIARIEKARRGLSRGGARSARERSGAAASVPLEVLDFALVLLGLLARGEGAEVAPLAGLRVGLAGIEAVLRRWKACGSWIAP